MASSFSTATSTWPQRMCACGYGHCFVKVSRSHKNPGHAYYVCPRPVGDEASTMTLGQPMSCSNGLMSCTFLIRCVYENCDLCVVHHGHHLIIANVNPVNH